MRYTIITVILLLLYYYHFYEPIYIIKVEKFSYKSCLYIEI